MRDTDARDAYLRRLDRRANNHLRRQHEDKPMPDPKPVAHIEELLARALFDADRIPLIDVQGWNDITDDDRESYRRLARAQVAVLAERGLLLPDGAEQRTERHYSPAHDGLVERRVIATPWSPVLPEPKEGTDA
jgi:hypothetical protein